MPCATRNANCCHDRLVRNRSRHDQAHRCFAAADRSLRAPPWAGALVSGELLWDARLRAGAQASPMTYVHRGRQYVAIAAARL
jgi:hypothetical protein